MDQLQSAKFEFDFLPEGKAASGPEIIEHENGDIEISGYAADFAVDRQNESFVEGAFERGLETYLKTNPILCYHHNFDKALGQVVAAELDGKGLKIRARLDKPATGSWAEDIYNKVKKGTIRAFSVGGIFRRKLTEKGWRIHDVDLAEISVTPVPVNPRTTFAVVAGKAFQGYDNQQELENFSEFEKEFVRLGEVLDKLDSVV